MTFVKEKKKYESHLGRSNTLNRLGVLVHSMYNLKGVSDLFLGNKWQIWTVFNVWIEQFKVVGIDFFNFRNLKHYFFQSLYKDTKEKERDQL